MTLLPDRSLELHSHLSPLELAELLASMIEPRRWLRFGSAERPFEGAIEGAEFDIQRIISYRNSFSPRIRGTIGPDPLGARVSVTMQLHPAVRIFMYVWFAGVSVAGLLSVASGFTGKEHLLGTLIPVGMFAFAWVLCSVSFAFEANKAEELLTALVQRTRRGGA